MKHIPFTLALVGLMVAPAFAKTYKVPAESSFASIDVPDSWKTSEIDKGIESQSEDGEIYFAVEATSDKGMDKTIDEAVEFLKREGVTVDTKTQKQTEGEVNGIKGIDVSWSGQDKDGAASISLTALLVSENKMLLITYWGSPEGEKKHTQELGQIIKSLKPVQ